MKWIKENSYQAKKIMSFINDKLEIVHGMIHEE